MQVTLINQDTITNRPLYYSRWHSISTEKRGQHYSIKVAGLVGPILNVSPGMFIITTYLTDPTIILNDQYTEIIGFKVWDIDIGSMYLEDKNGVRFLGCYESLEDTKDGLIPNGTNCIFTDNEDEAYIESYFSIRSLIPKKGDTVETGKDYSDAEHFVRALEPTIRDIFPEKFI